MKLPTTTILVFFLLCIAVPVLGLNTAFPSINSSGRIMYELPDYTVLKDGTVFKAINSETGATFSHEDSWVTINYAINAISSGTVYVSPGTYLIGRDTVIGKDASWVSAEASVSINNGVSGKEGVATQINIPYPAPTGLIAYYNFPTPVDLSSAYCLGLWFKPSTSLSSRGTTGDFGGSPLKFLIDDSTNCASPTYSVEIWHPEWVTSSWKYYKIPGTPPAGKALPTGLTNIRSIGIQVWSNPNCITPSTPYNIIIDDVHSQQGSIRTHSNIKLIGAGANETIIKLNPHANIPMVFMQGSNVEIAELQLDGNYDNQDTIDECMGIYNPSGGSGSKIHHNYVHHTKGGGIKLRGSNIEVYENLIEWTENPCVELAYSPSFIHVHHNTLKYPINDDTIRLSDAHDITIEYNELYGVTSALLASGDPSIPIIWRNKQPGGWIGLRSDRNAYNILIQYNKIYDAPGYGIAQCRGHDNTIQYNQIYNSKENQLSVQSWDGDCYNIHVIGNLAAGGAKRGLNIGGNEIEVRDNWTKNNAGGGIFISAGTGHYGSGNYAEETTNDAPASFTSPTSPSLPPFQAGITW
jgi:hypothetical protein